MVGTNNISTSATPIGISLQNDFKDNDKRTDLNINKSIKRDELPNATVREGQKGIAPPIV